MRDPAEIIKDLSNEDPEVCEKAAFALRLNALHDLQTPMLVLEQIGACDLAAELFHIAGPSAIDHLARQLRQGPEVRTAAALVLSRLISDLNEHHWSAIVDAATADEPVRTLAAEMIADAYAGPPESLVPLLEFSDSGVRIAVACALVRTGSRDGLPRVTAALESGTTKQRRAAAHALCDARPIAASTVAQLERMLRDNDPELRCAALLCLSALAFNGGDIHQAGAAVSRILFALEDPAYQVRCQAAQLLRTIGAPVALAALDPLFRRVVETREEGFFVSIPVVLALTSMGQHAGRFLCERLEQESDDRYRAAAATTLGEIGFEPAAPSLRNALDDSDWLVRLRAAAALTTCGDPHQALDYLARMVAESDWQVRTQTAFILGRLPGHAEFAVPALKTALTDPHSEVRRQAAESLGRRGHEAQSAVPDLWRLTADDSLEVRLQALRSLQDLLLKKDRERLNVVTATPNS